MGDDGQQPPVQPSENLVNPGYAHRDHIHAASESDNDRTDRFPVGAGVLPRAWLTDQLQPDWQPVREAARHRERRQPGHVPGIK
jgi:hypothetical protein